MESVYAFIQARMSSSRFPGKSLAPFRGRPILKWVAEAACAAVPAECVVVATSDEASDDPLAEYARNGCGLAVFRGSRLNVLQRFQQASRQYPSRWILRVNGDSPMLNPAVLQAVLAHQDREDLDLVTTIFPRTFPRGQNAELIRADALRQLDAASLSAEETGHVTGAFYADPDHYRILNVESSDSRLAMMSFAVDTVEDLQRLETVTQKEEGPFLFRPFVPARA